MSEKLQEALNRIQKAKETKAKELSLSGLNLRDIPVRVFELVNLKELNLRNN